MAKYDATNIHALILHLTWACLNVTSWIAPRFRTLFPSLDHLAGLYPKLGLKFVDGLYDIIQSDLPPSIELLLTLPTDIPSGFWGIYILVLQRGSEFKLYIGSGTSNARNGVRSRIRQHRSRLVEPKGLRDAKNAGFVQVRECVVAWCPKPSAKDVPVYRTAVVAVESAMHLIFWPMLKNTTAYGFPGPPMHHGLETHTNMVVVALTTLLPRGSLMVLTTLSTLPSSWRTSPSLPSNIAVHGDETTTDASVPTKLLSTSPESVPTLGGKFQTVERSVKEMFERSDSTVHLVTRASVPTPYFRDILPQIVINLWLPMGVDFIVNHANTRPKTGMSFTVTNRVLAIKHVSLTFLVSNQLGKFELTNIP